IVKDATGAVLAGASVQVSGPTIDRSTTTDAEGFYRVAPLPPGAYTVTTVLDGFTTSVLHDIVLPIDRTVTLDMPLDVAGRTESLTVAGVAPPIDRTNSALGGV